MSESDFADLPIQVVTTGHSKVMVPMLSRNKLDELIPNNKKLKAISAEIGCNGFFPLSWKGVGKNLLLMVECLHLQSV
ncbi:PhzF family phenazine biosynthesis protein [Acinetobacter baumannii]|nr:PhzF family phenazine biosynthesis protein [Acinetobacter baumannii]